MDRDGTDWHRWTRTGGRLRPAGGTAEIGTRFQWLLAPHRRRKKLTCMSAATTQRNSTGAWTLVSCPRASINNNCIASWSVSKFEKTQRPDRERIPLHSNLFKYLINYRIFFLFNSRSFFFLLLLPDGLQLPSPSSLLWFPSLFPIYVSMMDTPSILSPHSTQEEDEEFAWEFWIPRLCVV